MSLWFAEKENIVFILFVLSLVLIAFLIYDFLYSSIVVAAIISIAFIISLVKMRLFKPVQNFWLEFFENSYLLTFSIALAFLAFFLVSNIIFLFDSFVNISILVFLVSFFSILALVLSMMFLQTRLSDKIFRFLPTLEKSIIISLFGALGVILIAAGFGTYLYYTNIVTTFNTFNAESCRLSAWNACVSCYDQNNRDTSRCDVSTYLSEEDRKCVDRFALFVKGDFISCDQYIPYFVSQVRDLEIYRETESFKNQYFSSLGEKKSQIESRYNENSFLLCLAGMCYDTIIDEVYSSLDLAVNAYTIYSDEAQIGNELQSILNGSMGKTQIDEQIKRSAEKKGVNPILFDASEDTLQSYLEEIRGEVDQNYVLPQQKKLTDGELSFSQFVQLGRDLNTSDLPIGAWSIFDTTSETYGQRSLFANTVDKVLAHSSLGKGIFRLSVEAHYLYSYFVIRKNVLQEFYDNRDMDESLNSKVIRYRILYSAWLSS